MLTNNNRLLSYPQLATIVFHLINVSSGSLVEKVVGAFEFTCSEPLLNRATCFLSRDKPIHGVDMSILRGILILHQRVPTVPRHLLGCPPLGLKTACPKLMVVRGEFVEAAPELVHYKKSKK